MAKMQSKLLYLKGKVPTSCVSRLSLYKQCQIIRQPLPTIRSGRNAPRSTCLSALPAGMVAPAVLLLSACLLWTSRTVRCAVGSKHLIRDKVHVFSARLAFVRPSASMSLLSIRLLLSNKCLRAFTWNSMLLSVPGLGSSFAVAIKRP